jgi:integrase/recombinase XerD
LNEKVLADLPPEVVRFLDHLSVERGASKNTLLSYRRDLFDFFLRHETLNQENVSEHLAYLRKRGLASSSVSRKISALRSLEEFLLLSNPSRPGWRVDTKAKGRRLPKSIPYEIVKQILESSPGDVSGIRDRAILEVLYASGMRVSECISLDLDKFIADDKGTHFLRIVGKGSKERLVPLGEAAAKACSDYLVRSRPLLLKNRREIALFLNQRGDRISRQGVWNIIRKAAKRAGINEEITPHTFRHAFATHMIERGADVRSVQELLGHSSVVTTQIYTMVTSDTLRETHSMTHPRAR